MTFVGFDNHFFIYQFLYFPEQDLQEKWTKTVNLTEAKITIDIKLVLGNSTKSIFTNR